LLQVGGEAVQVLRIRQHGVRLGVVEVVVPDVEQTHQHRQVLGEVRGAEVFVHGVEARQDALPVFRPDRDDIGQADCRVDRVAAADPVPEPEGVLRIDAELGNLLEVGRYGHEMPADGLGPGLVRVVDDATGLQRVQQPVLGHPGVGHGLQGGEGLGRHDEQHGLGVDVMGGLVDVGRIDIADEAALEAGLLVGLERLVDHDGAQMGAADSDVDDGADRLAGDAHPLAGADLVGQDVHAVEHFVHLLDDIHAVNDQGGVARQPQRRVQHRTVLGGVDPLAGEHRLTAAGKVDLLGEPDECILDLVGQVVLGQIRIEIGSGEREPLGPVGIVGEPGAEINIQIVMQPGEFRPGGSGSRINGSTHRPSLWVLAYQWRDGQREFPPAPSRLRPPGASR